MPVEDEDGIGIKCESHLVQSIGSQPVVEKTRDHLSRVAEAT